MQVRRVPGDLVTRRQSAAGLDGSSSGTFEIGEFVTGRTLGKGTYGVVREARNKNTGQKVRMIDSYECLYSRIIDVETNYYLFKIVGGHQDSATGLHGCG